MAADLPAPSSKRASPPIPPAELDADLLFDAARLVALNGFAHECRLLRVAPTAYRRWTID
jgi:hypothetical protein